jgi:hypothetical protein
MTTNPWTPWLPDLERAEATGDTERAGAILEELWRFPFHTQRALAHGRWDRLFVVLVRLLGHDDAGIRDLAYHYARIAMADEYGPPYGRNTSEQQARSARRRTAQLLPAVTPLVASRALSLLRSVDDLVHVEGLVDLEPQAIVLDWIRSLAGNSPRAVAARIAYLDGRKGEPSTPELLAHLDEDDPMVRAYAARALGNRHLDADAALTPPLPELVDLITAKELARPGIAGPFVSNWYDGGLDDFAARAGVDVGDWFCTLLAKRQGPEPDTLPCSNGIDFFAHEIFGGSADYIRRLMAMGHDELAIEAATEVDERIDDLAPLLVELGHRDDAEVCRLASWSLASLYRQIHPAGAARGVVAQRVVSFRRTADAPLDSADLFVNLSPRPTTDGASAIDRDAYAAVLYPQSGEPFDDRAAAACLDVILPAALRGEALTFGLPGDGGQPGPWVFGRSASTRYASGALVELRGDVEARRWERIRVIWHGTPGAWRPEAIAGA